VGEFNWRLPRANPESSGEEDLNQKPGRFQVQCPKPLDHVASLN